MINQLHATLSRLLGLSIASGFDPYAPWHEFKRCSTGQHVIEEWQSRCPACELGDPLDAPPSPKRQEFVPPPEEHVEVKRWSPPEPKPPPTPPSPAPKPRIQRVGAPLRARWMQLRDLPSPRHAVQATQALSAGIAALDPSSTVALSALNRPGPAGAELDLVRTQPLNAQVMGRALPPSLMESAPPPQKISRNPRVIELTVQLPFDSSGSHALVLEDEDGAAVLTLIVGALTPPAEGTSLRTQSISASHSQEFGPIAVSVLEATQAKGAS